MAVITVGSFLNAIHGAACSGTLQISGEPVCGQLPTPDNPSPVGPETRTVAPLRGVTEDTGRASPLPGGWARVPGVLEGGCVQDEGLMKRLSTCDGETVAGGGV